ncbi:MAG: RND multidrug efflux transporter [Candidatus Carbobacillus altaicus]|uniref:RND multidrug efflux transporter n=1 Tax=Candidatus Carbonibacillus altaicus TaxID=2163959 RepID=A0A2R6Y0S4_9BACL|nr:MAG: RND multidrug efflux transporter [Candidatus Carbobacillus altaicus]
MQRVIRFSLNNKLALWILSLMVVIFGLNAGMTMPLELLPKIDAPILTVSAVYPGASPEEVQDAVTIPLEKRIQGLEGVTRYRSSAYENVTTIIVEYDYDIDIDRAKQALDDAVKSVSLPKDVQDVRSSKIDFTQLPVIALSVSGDMGRPELTRWADEVLLPALRGVKGVASIEVSGETTRRVELTFDEKALQDHHLTVDQVKQIVQGMNMSLPVGIYDVAGQEQVIRLSGSLHSVEELKDLPIPYQPGPGGSVAGTGASAGAGTGIGASTGSGVGGGAGAGAGTGAGIGPAPAFPVPVDGAGAPGMTGTGGSGVPPVGGSSSGAVPQGGAIPAGSGVPQAFTLPTVPLGELATVKVVDFTDQLSRTNGREALGLQILKDQNANTVDVVEGVQKELDRLSKDYPEMHIDTTFDQAMPIRQSVDTMLSKALIGALVAAVIVLLFLREVRSTLIAVISIPASLLIAIFVIRQLGITLNIMTLGALTVAIGRVVDDTIVVVENIYRRLFLSGESLRGKALIEAATHEMFTPISASTIVTVAVFLPIATVSGPVGQIFKPFAWTVVIALLASLLVAITIAPMLAHTFFRKKAERAGETMTRSRPVSGASGQALSSIYGRMLEWALKHKAVTFFSALFLLVASFALVPVVGVSFLPSDQEKMIILTYSPDPTLPPDKAKQAALDAEKWLMAQPGVRLVQFSQGAGNPLRPGGGGKDTLFYVRYADDFPDFAHEQVRVLDTLKDTINQGRWTLMQQGAGMSGSQFELRVIAPSVQAAEPVVHKVEDILTKRSDLANVKSDLDQPYPEISLIPNRQALADHGLVAAHILGVLTQGNKDNVITTLNAPEGSLDVIIPKKPLSYQNKDELLDQTIRTPLGTETPLKDLVTVEEGTSPQVIKREQGEISLAVTADVLVKDVGKVSRDVQKEVEALDLPSGVKIVFGGVTADIEDTFTQLLWAMAAAVLIVYLILVLTFHGGIAPFAILFSIPYVLIGALVALWLAGETISVSSMIGFLMLIGIVVTNAVVLIDRTIRKEAEGLSTHAALVEAAKTRVRPILMTALATIGALIPLAFGMEGSALISKGLAITVIGGLTSSTLLTLFIVPIVYEFLMRFRVRKSS